MSGLLGAFSWMFGGTSVTTVTLLGMLAFLLLRPERVVKAESFRRSLLLLVTSIGLPALLVLFADFKSLGDGGGLLLKLIFSASTLCSAGAVYFLIDSLSLGDKQA